MRLKARLTTAQSRPSATERSVPEGALCDVRSREFIRRDPSDNRGPHDNRDPHDNREPSDIRDDPDNEIREQEAGYLPMSRV